MNLFQPPEAEATSGKTLMAESCTQGDPDDCLLNGKVQHAVEYLHKNRGILERRAFHEQGLIEEQPGRILSHGVVGACQSS